jgi:hypothetical protein
MSKTPLLLRTVLLGTAALGAAVLLGGCPAPAPAPTPTETTQPDTTVDGIGGGGGAQLDEGSIDPPAADDGYTVVIDDLNLISIEVPETWTAVDGAPFTTTDGQEWASVMASTDLNGYFSDYTVSGMEYASTRLPDGVGDDDLKAFLGTVTDYLIRDCQIDQDTGPYSDPVYTGFVSVFFDCGGQADTWAFGVVAVDSDHHNVIYLRAQIGPGEDEQKTYDQLVFTFQSTIK